LVEKRKFWQKNENFLKNKKSKIFRNKICSKIKNFGKKT